MVSFLVERRLVNGTIGCRRVTILSLFRYLTLLIRPHATETCHVLLNMYERGLYHRRIQWLFDFDGAAACERYVWTPKGHYGVDSHTNFGRLLLDLVTFIRFYISARLVPPSDPVVV
jgi:hypothetical protein